MDDDGRASFEALCREEYVRVARTAFLITGDREEASDVAQEAFARAYEHWRRVARMERPGAWVQRVAANLAISWGRSQRVRRVFLERADLPEAVPDTAGDVDTMGALAALTPAQRAVVVLRYFADQSIEDTARALHKRPGTVRALSSQGLRRLRSAMSLEGAEA